MLTENSVLNHATFEFSELKNDPYKDLHRQLYGLRKEYDLVIVGAGLSGAVIAQQASSRSGLKSLVLDKRDHIGGNCFDYIDEHGIRVSKYGAHIFHTKHQRVWEYIQQFGQWIPYAHRVKGKVKDINGTYQIVPIPPNQVSYFLLKAHLSLERHSRADWNTDKRLYPRSNPR